MTGRPSQTWATRAEKAAPLNVVSGSDEPEANRGRCYAGRDFNRAATALLGERLNPLLAHVNDVVLVAELPQAGPGKTRTMKELERDYLAHRAARKVQESR